ncbi:hypothetical protein C8R47DRAFT_217838 [Mycena vitilis]|nr:hypothetical protein C8R47DRAFT_217838 [Mycena vitilis]
MSTASTSTHRAFPAAWDVAVCASVFFQGVLSTQLFRYTSACSRDSVPLKLFVAGLALVTWLKTIQSVAMLWLQNLTMFSSQEVSSVWATSWFSVMASAAIGFYVQMFFCYRLWAIGRNLYLVLATIVLFLVALAAAGVATYWTWTLSDTLSSLDWYAGYLGAGMCGDLLLTGGMVFSLLRYRQVVIPRGQTVKMLNALLRLTIQSAAPATIAAAFNLAACIQLNSSGNWFGLQLIFGQTSNMMLPLMYAITAMWTLNSRAEIRAVMEGSMLNPLDSAPKSGLRFAEPNTSTGPHIRHLSDRDDFIVISHVDEENSIGSVQVVNLQHVPEAWWSTRVKS